MLTGIIVIALWLFVGSGVFLLALNQGRRREYLNDQRLEMKVAIVVMATLLWPVVLGFVVKWAAPS